MLCGLFTFPVLNSVQGELFYLQNVCEPWKRTGQETKADFRWTDGVMVFG